ncbi:MAG: MFS transporter [Pirellulaceae bacterium]|nr:MFS transporter [Pirellulaceae bacterium]
MTKLSKACKPISPEPPSGKSTTEDRTCIAKVGLFSRCRNFVLFVFYQVTLRTGWIFKTETIVMPAALDSLGGSIGLRSWLPLLNRFGQSIPPLLVSSRLKILPIKKWSLAAATLGMALLFSGMASIWYFSDYLTLTFSSTAIDCRPYLFLILYGLFFAFTGVTVLAANTLQGKIISVGIRGRLMMVSNLLGTIVAVGAVLYLLPLWLKKESGQFEYIFGFSALCFLLATLFVLLFREESVVHTRTARGIRHLFRDTWDLWAHDRPFRKLAVVSMLFTTSMLMFPHYQNIGITQLDFQLTSLTLWLVLQNCGTAVFSILAGPLADRKGNKLVLHFLMFGMISIPLLALLFLYFPAWGHRYFYVVFILLGFTPVTFKTLSNYALEISTEADHPKYLSTLSLCQAIPILFSPIFGLVLEATNYVVGCFLVISLVGAGWLLTFRLIEPRHHLSEEEKSLAILSEEESEA